jgi:NAD(P)-dependent dehydrogenase (short-subunit alcohol dehydrogenase family)
MGQNGNFQRDENDSNYARNPQRQILVLGSSGALGSVIARHLSSDEMGNMQVLGADVSQEIPSELYLDDWQLHDFVHLVTPNDDSDSLAALTKQLWHGTAKFLDETNSPGLDAIVCASGGWTMDVTPAATAAAAPMSSSSSWEQRVEQMTDSIDKYAAAVRTMRIQNLEPVLAAAHLVSHMGCMNPDRDGLLVVLGAAAALSSSTPGMLSYGMAKSSAHRIVQTLSAATATSLESKSVRQAAREHYHSSNDNSGNLASLPHPLATTSAGLYRTTVLGILPTMLDTPNNRAALPPDVNVAAATASWTKPRDIAHQIGAWITEPAVARPHSGALLKVYPQKSPPSQRRGGGVGESLEQENDDDNGGGAVFELVR